MSRVVDWRAINKVVGQQPVGLGSGQNAKPVASPYIRERLLKWNKQDHNCG